MGYSTEDPDCYKRNLKKRQKILDETNKYSAQKPTDLSQPRGFLKYSKDHFEYKFGILQDNYPDYTYYLFTIRSDSDLENWSVQSAETKTGYRSDGVYSQLMKEFPDN
jgi:hypothetical protein